MNRRPRVYVWPWISGFGWSHSGAEVLEPVRDSIGGERRSFGRRFLVEGYQQTASRQKEISHEVQG